MVSANIKDKDAKISFLQKVIDVVSKYSTLDTTKRTLIQKKCFLEISTKQSVNVKPSKIVAGQEPERTNELLQLIGLALIQKISSTEAVKMVRNNDIPKSNKNSSTKPSKVIKQSSIDSVKTKSKSSDDTKTTTLKDNNKIVQKVKESKDKINEKQVKDRKEKETKIGRDVKKSTKDVKVSEKVKSEKIRPKNGAEVKKSTTKSIKEEPEDKVPTEVVTKVPTETVAKVPTETVAKVPKETVANVPTEIVAKVNTVPEVVPKDLMGEAIEKSNDSNDLHRSFEPEIVSVQIQSGLSKSKNEQDVNRAVNGDVPEKQKSARRSGKKVEKVRSEEKDDNAISPGKDDVPEAVPEVTSNGDNLEQNDIIQETVKATKEPKSSRKTSSKKEKEIFNANDSTSTRATNRTIESRNNSIDATEIPSIPRPRTSLRPPSVRPASARPGAPRRRDRNVEIILQPDGNMPKPGVNIKVDHLNVELDDDGENLVIIEDSSNQSNDNKFGIDTVIENEDEQQGHLVQQILETQKEFLKIDEDANEKRRTESVS